MLISIGESHAAKHQRIRVDHVGIYDPDRCGLRVLADGLGLEGLDPLFQTSRGDAMNIDKKLAHFVLQTGLLAAFKSRPRDSLNRRGFDAASFFEKDADYVEA